MKKLFALLTVVLFSGFMMAQNTSTVDQTGNQQVASVTQTGNNTSDIDQVTDLITGGKQTATVVQDGTLNSSIIDQNNTGGTQVVSNDAYINQIGTSNFSSQTTRSYGNQDINLWGLQNGLENTLTQATIGGYTSSFVAYQTGDLNKAEQTMTSSNTDGKIDQLGDGNYAKQYFTGQNHGYYTNGMLIVQTGDDNDATQEFHGGGWGVGSNGQIHQTGNLNNATQYSDGFPNTQLTTQVGDENQAETTQNGNFNSGIIYQDGNFNFGSISSTGNNNTADINQLGNSNSATITQTN
jgi:hypothetical protein